MISDVVLCVLCMQVLHSDLQVIHGDFQPFSTLHCTWYVNEDMYKSGPSFTIISQVTVDLNFEGLDLHSISYCFT